MRILIYLFVTLLYSPLLSRAQENEQRSDVKITFEIVNAGLVVNGSIQTIEESINFFPNDLTQSSVVVLANPATINTGIRIRDKHLQRSDYFDVDNFKSIRVESKKITRKGKHQFSGEFNLTIKNITKTIKVQFAKTEQNEVPMYYGSFEINRLDFNLGEESLILDEKVTIHFAVKTI